MASSEQTRVDIYRILNSIRNSIKKKKSKSTTRCPVLTLWRHSFLRRSSMPDLSALFVMSQPTDVPIYHSTQQWHHSWVQALGSRGVMSLWGTFWNGHSTSHLAVKWRPLQIRGQVCWLFLQTFASPKRYPSYLTIASLFPMHHGCVVPHFRFEVEFYAFISKATKRGWETSKQTNKHCKKPSLYPQSCSVLTGGACCLNSSPLADRWGMFCLFHLCILSDILSKYDANWTFVCLPMPSP